MRCFELALLVVLLLPQPVPAAASNIDIVKSWAEYLGDELWNLSLALTKSDQIRTVFGLTVAFRGFQEFSCRILIEWKYKHMNASVKKKDGEQILYSSLRSVSTMLTRKINAVKCIHATAERLAREFNYFTYDDIDNQTNELEFEYCSAKYSNFMYEDGFEGPTDVSETPKFAVNNSHYLNVSLERDSHFYDIFVNTNLSCVHVPTNIYYKEPDALNAILWSKDLNDVFIKNYQADPSLSWQYFGSSHGILRFYPGMPWNKIEVDTYDCRVKSWYIEAATCSKDVIILFDVSGSMTGFKNYVARRTLKSLLSTLSNNDYVIVYTFKKETENVVKCFDDLVQATPENIKAIEEFLEPVNNTHKVPLDGNANLTRAYEVAFKKLKQRRESKSCNVTSKLGCNQLVMVITDYVPGNLTEVFEEYNREVVDNHTYIPVRVFTFLIGKEVTNVDEIRWMACLNRGYFVHIHSVEEVQQQVLKYINVIARPMILQGDEPPPTWTHANIDPTRTKYWNVSGSDLSKPDEDKLVTSVALPAFDYKYNEEHNDAILLGVAGTDVPIDSIAKLAQPHQLGVNGYPLIVSNNGYLLLHPLLITSINGQLQENYNSVDFVEVEQVDDDRGPRELGDKIKALREKLVKAEHGNMTNVEVLFHYDDMRRIARVKHDYFFNELEGTPFAMGISLPRGYGDTELMLKDNPLEAKQGQDVTGINVTEYFNFNYRVHPDWVYCKYHYLEGHEASNPEIEIWNFLALLSKNKINISRQQYEEEKDHTQFTVSTHCDNRQPLEKDDYYCTEDLVKQLVFDAKLTTPYFKNWHATDSERNLAKKYSVSVRFIATSSGLTRWHYIDNEEKNERVDENGTRNKTYKGNVFGDKYHNAIEETWYKAAVLQHVINKESLVVSTKLPILDDTITDRPEIVDKDGDITITASYAIFYKDGDSETPASVVGFEYSYQKFHERFLELTNISNEGFACGDKHNCFVIDSSGYVVLSVPYNVSQVGQFFGEVNDETGYVMSYFVQEKVFDVVKVYNYQALCPSSLLEKPAPKTSGGFSLLTPFDIAKNLIRWLISELVILMMNWNEYAYADDDDYIMVNDEDIDADATTTPPPKQAEDAVKNKESAEETFSCDHSITLYILNQTRFPDTMDSSEIMSKDKQGDCHPAFWASYVTKTNLLLVVVEKENSNSNIDTTKCSKVASTKPVPTAASTCSSEPCHKLPLGNLTRRVLAGCFTYHEKERNITACGLGSIARMDLYLFLTVLMVALTSRLFS